MDICSLTVDLISSPYALSKWEQHGIFPTLEKDILKKSLYHAVFALKIRKLEMMIHENQNRLKENPPEEEISSASNDTPNDSYSEAYRNPFAPFNE